MDNSPSETQWVDRATDELRQVKTFVHHRGEIRPSVEVRVQRKWIVQEVPKGPYMNVWVQTSSETTQINSREEWRDLPTVEEHDFPKDL